MPIEIKHDVAAIFTCDFCGNIKKIPTDSEIPPSKWIKIKIQFNGNMEPGITKIFCSKHCGQFWMEQFDYQIE